MLFPMTFGLINWWTIPGGWKNSMYIHFYHEGAVVRAYEIEFPGVAPSLSKIQYPISGNSLPKRLLYIPLAFSYKHKENKCNQAHFSPILTFGVIHKADKNVFWNIETWLEPDAQQYYFAFLISNYFLVLFCFLLVLFSQEYLSNSAKLSHFPLINMCLLI